jgi:dTDP-4-amino-4,6-dideoxygalactose transaminase
MSIAPIRPNSRFLIFGSPLIRDAEIEEIVATLRSGWIGTGPKVAQFEKEFAAYKNAHHVAALNSCTAGLHLSLLAAGIGSGDEVITSALTFCATVNSIIHSGATPVLADVDFNSMNIDPGQVEARITSRTRAILPVHFAGRPCDMKALMDIADRHGLKVIEDCAHAIESEQNGKPCGTFGDFGCFSFYVTKNVATGEGGMVLARRENDISRIKVFALHGMSKDAWKRFSDQGYRHYQVVECGFKYNMMDLFSALPLIIPAAVPSESRHAKHLYTILVDGKSAGILRDEFISAMNYHNIGVGVHYLSIPEHTYYRNRFGWKPEDYPNAQRIGLETVSLPLSAGLTHEDVDDVVNAVTAVLP